jgi:hypothetical protein
VCLPVAVVVAVDVDVDIVVAVAVDVDGLVAAHHSDVVLVTTPGLAT